MDILKEANIIDYSLNRVYNLDDYVTMDVILMTKNGRFNIKELRYCNCLDPRSLILISKPQFELVLKDMIIESNHEFIYSSFD